MDRLTVFGEVLFDCFPTGEKILGGAPFNVAWHLQAFGQRPRFVSRVGEDEPGRAIRQAMIAWGMDTAGLQDDPQHDTGQVQVSLHQGEPSYEIVDKVAYDFVQADALETQACRMLYHGSLGLRSAVSREALEQLRRNGSPKVFMDVNLRDPWWQREQVLEWVGLADWVKLNEMELALLQGETGDFTMRTEQFLRRHHLEGVVVTRGAKGASLLQRGAPAVEVAPVQALKVADTVGAGDALASVLLLGISLGWPMRETLERAQHFASAIVGLCGATTQDAEFYKPFLESWGLS